MPTEIIPYLWIGDYKDSINLDFLNDKKIKVIINCTKDIQFLNDPELNKIKKIRIPVDDRPSLSYINDNMIMYNNIYDIVNKIHQYIINEIPVLVHCQAGKQRSATVIAAYYIMFGKVDVETAVNYIRSKRLQCFQPKNNFKLALEKFYNHLEYSEDI
jgi:dual specificity MAP kinase phosphatase